jgi:hypothetical protein
MLPAGVSTRDAAPRARTQVESGIGKERKKERKKERPFVCLMVDFAGIFERAQHTSARSSPDAGFKRVLAGIPEL